MDNELRIAILIDADNVSDKYIKIIVDEVANIGIATYKRIYGDWTSARLSSWKMSSWRIPSSLSSSTAIPPEKTPPIQR